MKPASWPPNSKLCSARSGGWPMFNDPPKGPLVLEMAPENAKPVLELFAQLDAEGRMVCFSLETISGADPAAASVAAYSLGRRAQFNQHPPRVAGDRSTP